MLMINCYVDVKLYMMVLNVVKKGFMLFDLSRTYESEVMVCIENCVVWVLAEVLIVGCRFGYCVGVFG